MWGHNSDGQLGDGTTTDKNFPILISVGGTTVAYASMGMVHTAVVTTGVCMGSLQCLLVPL